MTFIISTLKSQVKKTLQLLSMEFLIVIQSSLRVGVLNLLIGSYRHIQLNKIVRINAR